MIGIFAYADIIHLNISCPELGCKVFQKLTYAGAPGSACCFRDSVHKISSS